MNYLSQYYKNLSEQMQEKIKNLEYLLKEEEMKYINTKTQAQRDLENDAMNPSGGKSNRQKRKDFEDEVSGKKPVFSAPAPVADPNTGNENSLKSKEDISPSAGRKTIYPGSLQDITSRMKKDNTSILR